MIATSQDQPRLAGSTVGPERIHARTLANEACCRGVELSITSPSVPRAEHISYSAITTYQQCPLRYRFRYVDGLPEPFVTSSLLFGGAIHSALEFHFTERLIGHEPPSLDMLLDVFQAAWRERATEYDEIRFGKGETHSSLSVLALVATAVLTGDIRLNKPTRRR